MAKTRKHRLVVDITTSAPLTENKAARALRVALSSLWAVSNGAKISIGAMDIDYLDVKEYTRVVRCAKKKDRK